MRIENPYIQNVWIANPDNAADNAANPDNAVLLKI